MRRRSTVIVATVGLLLATATVATAAATSQDVACKITDNTLSCPLPQAAPTTVTKTVTKTKTVTAQPSSSSSAPSSSAAPSSSSAPASTTPTDPTTSASATTASSSTTPPTPAGCVGAANTPGGSDPWGGCWPGPQNTGYPHGLPGDTRAPVTLTDYTGPTTIKTCGVVIDSKTVPQDLLIQVGNGTDLSKPCVTIKNSLVKGVIFAEQANYGPVLIQDTEVIPDGLSWWENIGRSNFTAERVNSHGSEGVIKC